MLFILCNNLTCTLWHITSLLYFTIVTNVNKSESGSLRIFGHWNSRQRSAFSSAEGVKWPTDSSHCSWIPLKAKVARSECEVDGASDLEALFASGEEAKPPNILATVAGFQQKRKWLAFKPEKEKARFSSKRSHSFLTYAFSFSS